MIIAVVGPTGVGKTKLSIKLAQKYDAVIVNFDAVQVYSFLNIGSAKVTEEEKENVKHLMLDVKEPDEEYSVKEYQEDARKVLNDYKDRNIILVGGTGLYLSALLYDYRFTDDKSSDTFEDYTNDELYQMALEKDENMQIHKNNRQRLIRFLNKDISNICPAKLLYKDAIVIGLTTNRDNLYEKINNRVDKMFESGLLEEVKDLYQKYPSSKVLHSAIGYKEIIDYLNGNISLDTAKDDIKKKSRHYAKRQYTWFNNQMDVTWFNTDYDNFDNTVNEVISYVENKKSKSN